MNMHTELSANSVHHSPHFFVLTFSHNHIFKLGNLFLTWISSSIDSYRKIPKISPGAYSFQRPFLRGLSMEGNLPFKIDWDSLIVGRKFICFALFYFVFEGNFQVQALGGGGGLMFGGAIQAWIQWR